MTADEFSDRLWRFAARVAKIVDALPETRAGRHVAAQLIRCGTAAAPNYDEACAAESRRDFAHKVSLSAKEMRESGGWLKFVILVKLLPERRVTPLKRESEELLRMLVKSAITSRKPPQEPSSGENPQ
jgi:four helix bundle protein